MEGCDLNFSQSINSLSLLLNLPSNTCNYPLRYHVTFLVPEYNVHGRPIGLSPMKWDTEPQQ